MGTDLRELVEAEGALTARAARVRLEVSAEVLARLVAALARVGAIEVLARKLADGSSVSILARPVALAGLGRAGEGEARRA